MSAAIQRPDYRLQDNLWAEHGAVFLTGNQALVRLLLMQRARDAARGLGTAGFVSGYRGSPLGMLDQAIWKAGPRFTEAGIRFVPAINEELGATQVLGTQRVESDPERTHDGVFALWYGKGPGVDRAGDAIKHGNAYGSSPTGGVLVVAGDDHGCVSSSMPHQSDGLFQAFQMPVLAPSNIAEYLEFGLYGWALSRFSGNWVAFTALSEVVESGATVDLDLVNARVDAWADADTVRAATGFEPPPTACTTAGPTCLRCASRRGCKTSCGGGGVRPGQLASTASDRLAARAHRHRHRRQGAPRPDGSAAPARPEPAPGRRGRARAQAGPDLPDRTRRHAAFAQGLQEILVIEEKAPVVETADARPVLQRAHRRAAHASSARRTRGRAADSANWASCGRRASSCRWRNGSQHTRALAFHLLKVRDFMPPEVLSNAGDSVKRLPYFCAGCPHNTSTRCPTARGPAGIGCHFMANWMERDTSGLIQMGGEGVDWAAHSRFTRTPHMFQNLGDGTYYHSGYLAIRQAMAAKANITYKILYNDAVAMTGGQPVDGVISVPQIARQVESEGVKRLVIVSRRHRQVRRHHGRASRPAPASSTASELDAVQRELREVRASRC
jgi:indolepyruvate ferredoxin oxidoreductase